MNILINYADSKYRKAQRLNSWTGRHVAKFDKVIEYSPNDLDSEFNKKNERILSNHRGNGLWLWKPYIILKTLRRDDIKEGDVVFYCDSGALFFKFPGEILKIVETEGVWISVTPLLERQFTRKATFDILGCNDEKYRNTRQFQGGFIAIKKDQQNIAFIEEWLAECCNPAAIEAPITNVEEEEQFISHREDQSIISLLAKKRGVHEHQDPTQYGKLPEKYKGEERIMMYFNEGRVEYSPCILLHRQASPCAIHLFRQWLCAVLPRRIGLKLIR